MFGSVIVGQGDRIPRRRGHRNRSVDQSIVAADHRDQLGGAGLLAARTPDNVVR